MSISALGLLFGMAAAAAPQGEWLSYGSSQIPLGPMPLASIATTPQRHIQLFAGFYPEHPNSVLTYDGSRYAGQNLPEGLLQYETSDDYWIYEGHDSQLGYFADAFHVVGGEKRRAPGCFEGNQFWYLGKDAKGRRLFHTGWGFNSIFGRNHRTLRVDTARCDTVFTGFEGGSEWDAGSYAYDNQGREYFEAVIRSDVSGCGALMRVTGSRSESIYENTKDCLGPMAGVGSQVVAARTAGGFLVTKEKGVTLIEKVKGRTLGRGRAVFLDSRGILWLATDSNTAGAFGGVIAISGKDTTLYDGDNSAFPGHAAWGLGEDAEGNLWTISGAARVSIFQRGKLVVSLAERPGLSPVKVAPEGRYDAMGRQTAPKARAKRIRFQPPPR